jgi:hypothetical protein
MRRPSGVWSGNAKSLWYQNVLGNQGVRARALESDISEFESSHPSHAVGLAALQRVPIIVVRTPNV